jgi:hypothetical protein
MARKILGKKMTYLFYLIVILFTITVIGLTFKDILPGFEKFSASQKYELVDPKTLHVIQGVSSNYDVTKPIQFEEDTSKPSVDGTPNGPKSLFVFTFNQSSPECCMNEHASGYSSSHGCVCLSENQKKYFSKV